MANRRATTGSSDKLYYLGAPKSLWIVTAAMKLKNKTKQKQKQHLLLGREVMTNLDNVLESRDVTLWTQVPIVKLWFFQ